jgi:hypothetical protein
VLIEGCVGVSSDGKRLFEYNKAGQMFGDRPFALSTISDTMPAHAETLTVLRDSRFLEI